MADKKLLLWVDDEMDEADIAFNRRACEKVGFELIAACNGQEALQKIETLPLGKKPDIIATDVNMPVMDGLELTKILRSKGYTMPILVSSSNYSYENQALQAGANVFVYREIGMTTKTYLEAIENLMKKNEDLSPKTPIDRTERTSGHVGGIGG